MIQELAKAWRDFHAYREESYKKHKIVINDEFPDFMNFITSVYPHRQK